MITALIFNLALATASVAETELIKCYEKFPIAQDLLMSVTDKEFADSKKAEDRKKTIRAAYAKSPSDLRGCYEKIITFAKEQNDPANLKFVVSRLKEVSVVVYPQTPSAGDKLIQPQPK